MKKVAILVLSCSDRSFERLEDCIRRTWASDKNDLASVYFYAGGYDTFRVNGDRIECDCEDSEIGMKTIKSFEYLYENTDFDYVFRANISTYVHIENLLKRISDLPDENVYSGFPILNEETGLFFASGAGYLLSRDLVKEVIENKERWDHSLHSGILEADDVAIAYLLYSVRSIELTAAKRIDLRPDSDFSPLILDDNYHFRCKSSDNREDDIYVMEKLKNISKENDRRDTTSSGKRR